MHDGPSDAVTFLFTDIEGSTPLWDRHPDAMGMALARHDEIVRGAIDAAGGHVFSTGGDGFCVAFDQPTDAVTAAVAAQRSLAAEDWPEHVALRVRMGIHTGTAERRDGDYFGAQVNRAARVMGSAHGGQVVCSGVSADLIDATEAGVDLLDLGSVRLKGLVEPISVMGVTAPGLEWLDRQLVSVQTSSGNLPRPQTELVGDLAGLQARVSALADVRLVTLTGSGGVGKTRAAIEIGWLVLDEFPDGAWLVELGPIGDEELVAPAVASALGVQPQPGLSVVESIVDWCAGRRVLVIMDNCEHVLEPAVEIVSAIGSGTSTTTVIATSREPLGVPGEQVVRIESLATDFGVELFCDRAAAVGAGIAHDGSDLEIIGAICTRLDGIPLAIELAAARTRLLSPQEVLDRLDDRFRLLRGAGRGGIERHQTLRATVSWSYQLLSEQDQILFDRLSVFAGTFDLADAEAICGDEALPPLEIIELLGELVDKSMVIAERHGPSTRYRMLETMRQFAEDRLDARDEVTLVRDRHLRHFRTQSITWGLGWFGPDQLRIDAAIDAGWANLRAAHGWALATGDAPAASDVLAATFEHAIMRLRHEAAEWSEQTIQLGEQTSTPHCGTYLVAAKWAYLQTDPEAALDLATRGLDLAPDEETRALACAVRLSALGLGGYEREAAVAEAIELAATTTSLRSRYYLLSAVLNAGVPLDDPVAVALEMRETASRAGSPLAIAEGHRLYGHQLLLATPPDLEGAEAATVEAIALAQAGGFPNTEGWARGTLSAIAFASGSPDAPQRLREVVSQGAELHHVLMTDTGLSFVALCLAAWSKAAEAATVLGYCRKVPPYVQAAAWREQAGALIADFPDLEAVQAQGETMARHEIMAFVDHALAEI